MMIDKIFKKIISLCLVTIFFVTGVAPARGQVLLPAVGEMVRFSPALRAPELVGLRVYANEPFRFDFIVDKGDLGKKDTGHLALDTWHWTLGLTSVKCLQKESTRLIKYFLASLTIPEKDLWVNLSPEEKDRIVPEAFGQTEMGRDLLAQDYLLKQVASSALNPDEALGRKFWDEVYRQAQAKFGTTDIPVDTRQRVWIVPADVTVYEKPDAGKNSAAALVVGAKLKVMLETDYLALEKDTRHLTLDTRECFNSEGISGPSSSVQCPVSSVSPTEDLSKSIMRQVIVPALEKEVNEGEHFARLRQVYYSFILAAWYKKKLKDSIVSSMYADKNKVIGVDIQDLTAPQRIYDQYVESFKKGVFNFIKEEKDAVSHELIPRKYFSGGIQLESAMKIVTDKDPEGKNPLGDRDPKGLFAVSSAAQVAGSGTGPSADVGSDAELVSKTSGAERAAYWRDTLNLGNISGKDVDQYFELFRNAIVELRQHEMEQGVRSIGRRFNDKHFMDIKRALREEAGVKRSEFMVNGKAFGLIRLPRNKEKNSAFYIMTFSDDGGKERVFAYGFSSYQLEGFQLSFDLLPMFREGQEAPQNAISGISRQELYSVFWGAVARDTGSDHFTVDQKQIQNDLKWDPVPALALYLLLGAQPEDAGKILVPQEMQEATRQQGSVLEASVTAQEYVDVLRLLRAKGSRRWKKEWLLPLTAVPLWNLPRLSTSSRAAEKAAPPASAEQAMAKELVQDIDARIQEIIQIKRKSSENWQELFSLGRQKLGVAPGQLITVKEMAGALGLSKVQVYSAIENAFNNEYQKVGFEPKRSAEQRINNLERVDAVIEALKKKGQQEISFQDLLEQTGLSKSALGRLSSELKKRGVVFYNPQSVAARLFASREEEVAKKVLENPRIQSVDLPYRLRRHLGQDLLTDLGVETPLAQQNKRRQDIRDAVVAILKSNVSGMPGYELLAQKLRERGVENVSFPILALWSGRNTEPVFEEGEGFVDRWQIFVDWGLAPEAEGVLGEHAVTQDEDVLLAEGQNKHQMTVFLREWRALERLRKTTARKFGIPLDWAGAIIVRILFERDGNSVIPAEELMQKDFDELKALEPQATARVKQMLEHLIRSGRLFDSSEFQSTTRSLAFELLRDRSLPSQVRKLAVIKIAELSSDFSFEAFITESLFKAVERIGAAEENVAQRLARKKVEVAAEAEKAQKQQELSGFTFEDYQKEKDKAEKAAAALRRKFIERLHQLSERIGFDPVPMAKAESEVSSFESYITSLAERETTPGLGANFPRHYFKLIRTALEQGEKAFETSVPVSTGKVRLVHFPMASPFAGTRRVYLVYFTGKGQASGTAAQEQPVAFGIEDRQEAFAPELSFDFLPEFRQTVGESERREVYEAFRAAVVKESGAREVRVSLGKIFGTRFGVDPASMLRFYLGTGQDVFEIWRSQPIEIPAPASWGAARAAVPMASYLDWMTYKNSTGAFSGEAGLKALAALAEPVKSIPFFALSLQEKQSGSEKAMAHQAVIETDRIVQDANSKFFDRQEPWRRLINSPQDLQVRAEALKILGADMRLFENKSLNPVRLAQFHTIRRIINPVYEEGTAGIYLASASDSAGFFELTNNHEGYFLDVTPVRQNAFVSYLTDAGWDSLDGSKVSGLNDYKMSKWNGGWVTAGNEGINNFEQKILFELKQMGVKKDSIHIDGEDGNVSVSFKWAYYGEEEKPRVIHFITADLLGRDPVPSILSEVKGKANVVLLKAGLELPYHYEKFLPQYAAMLKSGGFLVTDNYFLTQMSSFNGYFPEWHAVYGYNDPDKILQPDGSAHFRRVKTSETDFIQSEFSKRIFSFATLRNVREMGNFVIGSGDSLGNKNREWGWVPKLREGYPSDVPRENENLFYGSTLQIRQKLDDVAVGQGIPAEKAMAIKPDASKSAGHSAERVPGDGDQKDVKTLFSFRRYPEIIDRLIQLQARGEKESLQASLDAAILASADPSRVPCCVNHSALNVIIEAAHREPRLKSAVAQRVGSYLMRADTGEMLKSVIAELVQKMIAIDMIARDRSASSFISQLSKFVSHPELVLGLTDFFVTFRELRGHDHFWHESLSGNDVIVSQEKHLFLKAYSPNWYFLFEDQRPVGVVYVMASRSDRKAYISSHIFDKSDTRKGFSSAVMRWVAGKISSEKSGAEEGSVTVFYPAKSEDVSFMLQCVQKGIFSRVEGAYARASNAPAIIESSTRWTTITARDQLPSSSDESQVLFIRGVTPGARAFAPVHPEAGKDGLPPIAGNGSEQAMFSGLDGIDNIEQILDHVVFKALPANRQGGSVDVWKNDRINYVLKIPKMEGTGERSEEEIFLKNEIYRTRLMGLAPETHELRNIKANLNGEIRSIPRAMIQKYTKTLRDKVQELSLAGDQEKIRFIIQQWWELQLALWRRGVVDQDIKILDNYGYDEETGKVLILDFTHISTEIKDFWLDQYDASVLDAYHINNISVLRTVAGEEAENAYNDFDFLARMKAHYEVSAQKRNISVWEESAPSLVASHESTAHKLDWLASGQITEEDILQVARKNGIDIGSKSIVLHVAASMEGTRTYQIYNDELFKDENAGIVMVPYQIRESQLHQLIDVFLRSDRIRGISLGSPFKTMVAKYVQESQDPSAWLGFDMVVKDNGKLQGFRFNSDAWVKVFKDGNYGSLVGKKVVVFGAGSTGCSLAVSLIPEGVGRVTLVEKNDIRRHFVENQFSGHQPIFVLDAKAAAVEDALAQADYIINATGLGREGSKQAMLPISSQVDVRPGAIFFDLNYNPPVTEFMRIGQEKGARAINGAALMAQTNAVQAAAYIEQIEKRKADPADFYIRAKNRMAEVEKGEASATSQEEGTADRAGKPGAERAMKQGLNQFDPIYHRLPSYYFFAKSRFLGEEKRIPGKAVWRLQAPADEVTSLSREDAHMLGGEYFLKLDRLWNIRNEIFGYKAAKIFGVNTADIKVVPDDFLRIIPGKPVSPVMDEPLTRALMITSADKITTQRLTQKDTSGLEEWFVFCHFMHFNDFDFSTGLNVAQPVIDGLKRYVFYDIGPSIDKHWRDSTSYIASGRIKGHGRWNDKIVEIDPLRLKALIEKAERMDPRQLLEISDDLVYAPTEETIRYRQKNFRREIIEGLEGFKLNDEIADAKRLALIEALKPAKTDAVSSEFAMAPEGTGTVSVDGGEAAETEFVVTSPDEEYFLGLEKLGSGAEALIYRDPDPRHPGRFYKLMSANATQEEENLRKLKGVAGIPRILRSGKLSDGRLWMHLDGIENGQDFFDINLTYAQQLEVLANVADILASVQRTEAALVHNDVKPGNIIIDSQDLTKVMLIDWSLARQVGMRQKDGTREYAAPEALKNDRSDVFSLGRVLKFNLTRPLQPKASVEVWELREQMLKEDPQMRPSLTEVAGRLRSIAKDAAMPPSVKAEQAMKGQNKADGGIDLGSGTMDMKTTGSGGEFHFNLSPEDLKAYQNAPGLTPVIFSIQPLESVQQFLGMAEVGPMAAVGTADVRGELAEGIGYRA